MATGIRKRGEGITIPWDYEERVYAGVLGKIIGVYLGRPFEGWLHRDIEAKLGEIQYYVHERLNAPLIVSDDDISGTFTFLRALADHGTTHDLTAEQIGDTWLNYLIDKRTVLWWGGVGMSTEHTAFQRLKQGITAPDSGSIARNGKVVAEQIGAQIFIDGWAMVCPGDPEKAVALAGKAASVSHDGEAIYGAQVIAAMESLAFVEPSIPKLLETAATFIPPGSIIYRLIKDLRAWHAADPHDWRAAFHKIEERYGYAKYGGGCHIVPNHAIVVLALLYGEDDFQRSLMIANTAGWDTDCNSANVGCLMGIKNGLVGISAGPDYRGPVADRMYLPTADGARCVTDAVTETYHIVNLGRALQGMPPVHPKEGLRFHFHLPGSVQGFVPEDSSEARGVCRVENVPMQRTDKDLVAADGRTLAIAYQGVALGRAGRVATATFPRSADFARGGYSLMASPTLYPGQTVRARIVAEDNNALPVEVCLYVRVLGKDDALEIVRGPVRRLAPGAEGNLNWDLPAMDGRPIAEVGIEVGRSSGSGMIYLDWLTWDGSPRVTFGRPKAGEQGHGWRRAWVDAADKFEASHGGEDHVFKIIQNEGVGLVFQGDYQWGDYTIRTEVDPHLADEIGIVANVRGMRRYVALTLRPDGKAYLIQRHDREETVLAEAAFPWKLDRAYLFSLTTRRDGTLQGIIRYGIKEAHLEARVAPDRARGAIGLLVRVGHGQFGAVRVEPVE